MRQTSIGMRSNRSNVQIILHFNSTFNPLRLLKPILVCVYFLLKICGGDGRVQHPDLGPARLPGRVPEAQHVHDSRPLQWRRP
jgi:hypothetical protein